jgi:hypothetical protein
MRIIPGSGEGILGPTYASGEGDRSRETKEINFQIQREYYLVFINIYIYWGPQYINNIQA